jgi:Uma2 family endonuclease
MSNVAAERITVEAYRAMPEGPPYYQLVEGELIMSPAPTFFHQVVARNAFRILDDFLRQHRLGEVYFAPIDVYLSDKNVFQPDLFFLSNANKKMIEKDGIHGGPDLVVEIVSPSNGALDKRRKLPVYAQYGVKEEWLIEPALEKIHRYEFATDAAKPVRIIENDETFETPLLPGLVISAADVFRR